MRQPTSTEMNSTNWFRLPLCPFVSFVVKAFRKPQRPQRWWPLIAILAFAVAYGHAQQQQSAATHIVTIKAMKYQPDQLEVKAGDTVEWKNEDIVAHTVTARDHSFDSGKIVPGKSWSTVVKSAGTIDYGCVPHPNMKGKLVVK